MKQVASKVRAAGMSREWFDFFDRSGEDFDFTSLMYLPDASYHFDFYPGARRWAVEYSPGEDTPTKWEDVGDWESALVRVDWWLEYLQRELRVGDPWSEAVAGALGEVSSGPSDNERFTQEEREQVIARIDQLKTFLLDSEYRSEQDRRIIVERLDYLTEASGRLGRFDWRGVAASTVIDLALLGYVERDTVRHVVDFVVGAVRHLLTS